MSRLPQDWRSMTVKQLRRWLIDNGQGVMYLSELKRHEIIEWIERYIIAQGKQS